MQSYVKGRWRWVFLCQIYVVGVRGLCYNIDERTSLLWRLLSSKALKGHVDYKKSKGKSLYWILQSVASDWESVLTDYLFVPSNYTSQIRGNKSQSERTDCLIRGNELQSKRTDCLIRGNELPIRVNELLIRENRLHNSIYRFTYGFFFENLHVPSGLS